MRFSVSHVPYSSVPASAKIRCWVRPPDTRFLQNIDRRPCNCVACRKYVIEHPIARPRSICGAKTVGRLAPIGTRSELGVPAAGARRRAPLWALPWPGGAPGPRGRRIDSDPEPLFVSPLARSGEDSGRRPKKCLVWSGRFGPPPGPGTAPAGHRRGPAAAGPPKIRFLKKSNFGDAIVSRVESML